MKIFQSMGLIALTTMSLNVFAANVCEVTGDTISYTLQDNGCASATKHPGAYLKCTNGKVDFQIGSQGCIGKILALDGYFGISGAPKPPQQSYTLQKAKP